MPGCRQIDLQRPGPGQNAPSTCPCQGLDLLVQNSDHADQAPDSGGDGGRITRSRGLSRLRLRHAARIAVSLVGDRCSGGRRLGRRRPTCTRFRLAARAGSDAFQQLQSVRDIQVVISLQRQRGTTSAARSTAPLHVLSPLPGCGVPCAHPAPRLDALPASGLSPPPPAADQNRSAPCPPACASRRHRSWPRTRRAAPGTAMPAAVSP